jgi:hypothetical protein
LDVLYHAVGVSVLLITGIGDKAPVATLSRLVLESRLIEVYVQAAAQIQCIQRGYHGDNRDSCDRKSNNGSRRASPLLNHSPTFIFNNDTTVYTAAEAFAKYSCFFPYTRI